MTYKIGSLDRLRAELRKKYRADQGIAALIPSGDRTGTTRQPPAGVKVGDIIEFRGVEGQYRVTGFHRVDLKTAAGREEWSRHEGWSPEASATFGNQVRDGATQMRFERVDAPANRAAAPAPAKQGHAQPLTAQVLTPSGFRLMGDLHAGDEVITLDGSATQVEAVYPQGPQPIYRVVFSDWSETRTTADHLWRVRPEGEDEFRVMTLAEIMGEPAGRRFEIPPLGGPEGFTFATNDVELANSLEEAALARGMMGCILPEGEAFAPAPGLFRPWTAEEKQRLEDVVRELGKLR